jgi:hypothetical protein
MTLQLAQGYSAFNPSEEWPLMAIAAYWVGEPEPVSHRGPAGKMYIYASFPLA